MDYKKLADDLLSYCHLNCSACEYAGDALECTIKQLASTAITDLLARAEAAEQRCKELEKDRDEAVHDRMMMEQRVGSLVERVEKAEEIASDLCDDFTDFVTGGVHNAAPYCANRRPECVNAHGWCDGDNRVCRGFMPKAGARKKEE